MTKTPPVPSQRRHRPIRRLEAALTATLLLRGLTFWLPMLPGLWIARRELRPDGNGSARLSDDRPSSR